MGTYRGVTAATTDDEIEDEALLRVADVLGVVPSPDEAKMIAVAVETAITQTMRRAAARVQWAACSNFWPEEGQ